MFVERYLSNKEQIGIDNNGFLIGEIAITKDSAGITHYDYSLEDYQKIGDILENSYSIIIGNGGLGKSVLLTQVESYLKGRHFSYFRINLCSLTTEGDLIKDINIFLTKNSKTEPIYLLLDAVDEAIDHNIRNPIELISKAVKNGLNINQYCRFIITARSQVNNIEALSQKLKAIYKIEGNADKFIYKLCPLTKENVELLSKNAGISYVEKFLEQLQAFSLSGFLTTPITLKTVVDLYKKEKINNSTNHYYIFKELINNLCEESSEYRRKQAQDGIGKFNNYPPDEILFIAAKIAIDLKIKNKASVSVGRDANDNSICAESFYNLSIKTFFNKHYSVSKEIVDATLNTKLFYKSGDEYLFCQKTYFDFLCAYYLVHIGINIKKFNKIFVFEKRVHPNYYDIVSLLAIKDEKFFKYYLKNSPEALIFSNIVFNCAESKKELLKKYLRIIDKNTYYSHNINSFFINKKLYSSLAGNIITKAISSNNEDILTAVIDFISVNKLGGLDKQIKKIIYDKKYSNRLKMFAILAIKENIEYKSIIIDLYQNLDKLNSFLEKDDDNNLRAVILETMYPTYFNDEMLLSYIVPVKRSSYFGWYKDFLRKEFLNAKYINKNNVLYFFKWVLNNKIEDVTTSPYDSDKFTDTIERFFVRVADFIEDKEIIDEIIKYQINSYRRTWVCFSKSLFDRISKCNKVRLYALRKFIQSSNEDSDLYFLTGNSLFQSKDIAYIMTLFHHETDKRLKEKYKKVLDNAQTIREYFYNYETKDVEYIFNIFKHFPELENEFQWFATTVCAIDPFTGDPNSDYSKEAKKYYQDDKKKKARQQKAEEEKIKKQEFHNDEPTRIKENIEKYNETKNACYILKLFYYLVHPQNHIHEDCYARFLDFANTENWNKLEDNLQKQIINLCLDYLKNCKPLHISTDIKTYIEQGKQLIIWNCLGALIFYKTNVGEDEYTKLLCKHKSAILYFYSHKDVDKELISKLIFDLYNLEKDYIKEQISELIKIDFNYKSNYTDMFFKFSMCITDFSDFLLQLHTQNENELSPNASAAIIEFLILQKNTRAVDICIGQISKNVMNNNLHDDLPLMSYLKILLENFQPKYWTLLKKIFYVNQKGIDIFKSLASCIDSHSCPSTVYEQLSNKDLVDLYKWVKCNIKEKDYSEITHDYKPEENIASVIYNYWLNTGNYKCMVMIKNTMRKDAYKRSYNLAFNQYLIDKKIDVNEFEKLENPPHHIFSFMNFDNSININAITNSNICRIGHTILKKGDK